MNRVAFGELFEKVGKIPDRLVNAKPRCREAAGFCHKWLLAEDLGASCAGGGTSPFRSGDSGWRSQTL